MKTPANKIHILVVVRWPVGGIRTFLRYVYGRFPTERFRFTIVLPELSELEVIRKNLAHQEVNYVLLPPYPTHWQFVKKINQTLKKGRFDIVHSHGFTSGIHTALCARMIGIPHLMTAHDVFTAKQFQGIQGWIRKAGLTQVFKFVDFIHCVSLDAKENFLTNLPELRSCQSRIIAIPNGIDTSRFLTEAREDFRKIQGVGRKDFLLGFFGRFMTQKGFRYLVDALELLNRQSLSRKIKVLCFGWGGFIREEQEMLAQRGLGENFLFLEFREDIAPALRGLDAVVMPSLWEAYGLLAAETLVAGTPLIATDCVGLREVLKNTPARIVPAGDAQSLADAIAGEIQAPSSLQTSAFRDRAAAQFDVCNQVAALQVLIERICKKGQE